MQPKSTISKTRKPKSNMSTGPKSTEGPGKKLELKAMIAQATNQENPKPARTMTEQGHVVHELSLDFVSLGMIIIGMVPK